MYQYKVDKISDIQSVGGFIQAAGRSGWEFMQSDGTYLFFRRPI